MNTPFNIDKAYEDRLRKQWKLHEISTKIRKNVAKSEIYLLCFHQYLGQFSIFLKTLNLKCEQKKPFEQFSYWLFFLSASFFEGFMSFSRRKYNIIKQTVFSAERLTWRDRILCICLSVTKFDYLVHQDLDRKNIGILYNRKRRCARITNPNFLILIFLPPDDVDLLFFIPWNIFGQTFTD